MIFGLDASKVIQTLPLAGGADFSLYLRVCLAAQLPSSAHATMNSSKGDSVLASVGTMEVSAVSEKNGTQRDEVDMDRMGKLQQLRVRQFAVVTSSCVADRSISQRDFKFMSIFGYAVILGSTWEYALVYVPSTPRRRT